MCFCGGGGGGGVRVIIGRAGLKTIALKIRDRLFTGIHAKCV